VEAVCLKSVALITSVQLYNSTPKVVQLKSGAKVTVKN